MRFNRLLGPFVAVLLLAACETAPEETAVTTGEGAAAESAEMAAVEAAALPGTQDDLTAQYGDRVFFDFDKYSLKPPARETIMGWAAWLGEFPAVTATIQGHADERGTREYNLALGERRSTSTKNYLVALGIDPNRIGTISYGKERPAVEGSNEAAWAQNRRGVLVVSE
ncbi:MAG: peptidoglycan-associated lipoprotein Pal [Proteobacteria bacterium]|nr:peptidoglycan-associated lipoprotein Pal [Pseudomonadota bacterium]